MPPSARPRFVTWDITYACPLRCAYCYSESGRRPSRALDPDRFMQVTDALISAGIRMVAFSGGEPTLVPGLVRAARRFREARVTTKLYTSGHGIDRALADQLVAEFRRIHVSVDGATAATHDRIRGRPGSFEQAMRALALLAPPASAAAARVGVEFTAVQSNFHEIAPFCQVMARHVPGLNFIAIGAAIPSGLASRASYADAELLDGAQLEALRREDFTDRLKPLVPASTLLSVSDNWDLLPRELEAEIPVQIEADGAVRAFPIYEGTVGNVLDEPLEAIWARARERHRDPFIGELLSKVSTMAQWAAAARLIDQRFGSAADVARIRKRPD